MSPFDRRLGHAILAATVLALVGLGILWVVLPPLIEEAYLRPEGALLGGVISGQKRLPLEGYLLFFRRTLAALAITAAVVGSGLPWLLRWSARTRGALSTRTAWMIVAGLAMIVAALRCLTFGEAQDRDLMAYMMVADGMLDGRTLYAGIWDHKPPALHISYAIAAFLFGRTDLAIWVLGVVTAIVTLVGCYRAGRLVGGVAGGVAAACVWALAGGDLLLQANQPNAESFMNACLVWAFVMTMPDGAAVTTRRWVVAGLLFFAASLYKPIVVAIVGLVMAAHALVLFLESPSQGWLRRGWQAIRPGLVVAVVAGAGWALTVGYFVALGRGAAFEEAVFAYNRDYAGSLVQNLLATLLPNGAVVWTAAPYFPMLVVVGVGVALLLRGSVRAASLILLAYLVGAWIAVGMPGRLYPHYYQLLLPPMVIGLGWLTGLAFAAQASVRLTFVGAAVALALAARVYQSLVPAAEIPVLKFGGYGYDLIETRRMGPWIAAHVAPDASIYHWGADPGVYFYAHHSSPTPFVYNMPLTDRTDRSRRYTAQVLSDLQRRPPALVVAARREFASIDHPIEVWIDERYRSIAGPDGVERFVFLVPREKSTSLP